MTMSNLPSHEMTAQECKQYAMQLTARAWTIPQDDFEQRANLLAEAQVWATLATVPEPLEEEEEEEVVDLDPVVSQLLLQQPELPNLICPHGYQAQIDTIEAEGRPVQLRYRWSDCETCP